MSELENKENQEQELDTEQELGLQESSDLLEETTEEIYKENISEVQEKAKKTGHLSKEEWIAQGRDPARWKDPKEFVEFGDSYTKLKPHIDTLKDEIKKQKLANDAILKHLEEVKQREFERGKAEVEAQIRQAKEIGDIDTVEKLTKDKTVLESREQQNQLAALEAERFQVLEEFKQRNAHWFNADHPELVEEARAIDQEIRNYYPGLSYRELARRLETRMKYDHPELFSQNRTQPVMATSRSNINKSTMESQPSTDEGLYNRLSADQKQEYKSVKNMLENGKLGIKYTVKEYLTQVKERTTRKGE